MVDIPLSDETWQRVSYLLCWDSRERFGRRARDPRDVLNAILWVITSNEKWHRLPAHFPPARTCYIKWLQWQRVGLMRNILEKLEIDEV
ncbi:transposase [Paraburkholderia sp. D1E]|uniref:transposase n=1 Tax=Paraburkholderia sp. D1E TaxID=3461398 RepID=UPI0040465008